MGWGTLTSGMKDPSGAGPGEAVMGDLVGVRQACTCGRVLGGQLLLYRGRRRTAWCWEDWDEGEGGKLKCPAAKAARPPGIRW